jgi:hypothetical protein
VLAQLDEVQWADWARGGELLTATTDGRLQIRDRVTRQVSWEHDLAPLGPDCGEPPAEARHWQRMFQITAIWLHLTLTARPRRTPRR